MSWSRVGLVAIACLGLTAAVAQQREATTAATAKSPPLFQGIMEDAKGKTVGRLGAIGHDGANTVIRQINGTWVEVQVDVTAGFVTTRFDYWYQSSDCTGQPYLLANGSGANVMPGMGLVYTIPPATAPSIYFVAQPSLLTMQSVLAGAFGSYCEGVNRSLWVGIPQSVLVSSLGLTPPFSVK
jgi:hypothetical protein